MTALPTAPVVAAGLIGGYASARHGGRDDLATGVFIGAGAWCVGTWRRRSGHAVSNALLGCYLAAFYVSHPLAKKIGGWPSVLAVTAVAAGVTVRVADRPPSRGRVAEPAGGVHLPVLSCR
jgi:hypothetical protein